MSQFLEALMIISFGVSWPINIIKSYRTRSTSGKSLPFLFLVFSGYIFGIAAKLISGAITYVFVFYVINLLMVGIDIALYFRNRRLDASAVNTKSASRV